MLITCAAATAPWKVKVPELLPAGSVLVTSVNGPATTLASGTAPVPTAPETTVVPLAALKCRFSFPVAPTTGPLTRMVPPVPSPPDELIDTVAPPFRADAAVSSTMRMSLVPRSGAPAAVLPIVMLPPAPVSSPFGRAPSVCSRLSP